MHLNPFPGVKTVSKENLKKLRSADKTILTNSFGTATVTKHFIGNLALPTGRIIMCDPYERYSLSDIDRKMFSRAVVPGEYPIWIYLAETESDITLAFAELRFSENSPASFVAAKSQYDVDHHRTGYFGYPVSYNGTGFMDAQVFREICNLPWPQAADCLLVFDNPNMENADVERLSDIGTSKDGKINAVRFRVNSGIYYWYWGIDNRRKPCALIADFFSYR